MPVPMKPAEKLEVLKALKKHVDGLLTDLFENHTMGELATDTLTDDDRKFIGNCIGDAVEVINNVLSDIPTEAELAGEC